MRYGSVCSGVAPQTQAWSELGWQCAWFAEIEPFPSAVLQYRFPDVPNLGDFTRIDEHTSGPIDVLVGGTPCQSFSVAGKRAGLDDPRGNLTIEFARLAQRLRPRWLVWENVPGVLSIDDGRTFGAFLGILGELGYGVAYRVLDAQYFGVAQRRRRVFVVGHLGDWRRAAAVLFERESLSGNPAPSREARQGTTYATAPSLTASGRGVERTGESRGQDPVIAVPELARCLSTSNERIDWETETFVATLGHSQSNGRVYESDVANTLEAVGSSNQAIAFSAKDHGAAASEEACGTFRHGGSESPKATNGYSEELSLPLVQNPTDSLLHRGMAVRRLTPRECERLQGMSDDFTLIPWKGKNAPDGPRYKAIGNSWAVPVLTWIAKRINQVEENS
jgi:DNA (cytosine-5)-methyltransferase 1